MAQHTSASSIAGVSTLRPEGTAPGSTPSVTLEETAVVDLRDAPARLDRASARAWATLAADPFVVDWAPTSR